MKTIVVGDIHGCFEEFQALLSQCKRQPEDQVISVGDLVDRGPDPRSVVEFFMNDSNAHAILGNHEDNHIRIRKGNLEASLSQAICKTQLGSFYDDAVDYFESLPLYLQAHECLIVHAGFVPNVPIEQQPRNAFLRGRMPWMKSHYDKSHGGWWTHYRGARTILYGHSAHPYVHIQNNTYGLDTGCCHGNLLSALVLPERTIVEIKSAEDHWSGIRSSWLKNNRAI